MKSNLFSPIKPLNNKDSYYFNIEKNQFANLKTAKDSRSPSLEETDFTNNLITRKTFRGRKEKIPFPKNKLKCEICLEFADYSKEDLISCSMCKCLFHKCCYENFAFFENSSYMCIRCTYAVKLNKSINEFNCFICGNSNGVLNINSATKCFYHKICLDLLIEFKGLEGQHIYKEKVRKWRYKNSCRYCGEKLSKNKAVIKCKNPKCKEFYHIPCAIEKGMIFDLNYMKKFYNVANNNEIPFYCSNHNKKISFKFKTYINNSENCLNCNKNLFRNDFNINENDEQMTFHELDEDIGQNHIIENEETISGNKEIELKNINNNVISIIEEENINNKDNENILVQKNNENDGPKENNINNNIDVFMDIDMDDSFDKKNNSNAFKLDFEKYFKENEKNNQMNDDCISNDKIFKDNIYQNFGGFNPNNNDFNNTNEILFCRQKSFKSLSFIE